MRGYKGTIEERFWRKVKKTDNCWLWIGATHREGYGQFGYKGKIWQAHRVAWDLAGRAFEEGKEMDHLCRVRNCVNTAHLELVTKRTNQLRGVSFSAINAAKTHCIHGHEFTEENTYVRDKGRRGCRTCGLIAHMRYSAKLARMAA